MEYEILTDITSVPDSATEMYANPEGKKTYVRLIVVHNRDTNANTITLNKVAYGASATGANQFHEEEIEAKGVRQFEYNTPGLILKNEGDAIYARASASDKINIYISGGVE